MSVDTALRAMIADIVREEIQAALAEVREATATAVYLTVRQACDIASVSSATLRRWIRKGKLTGYGAGRGLRVRRDDLESYLEQQRGTRSVELSDAEIDRLAAMLPD